MPGYRTGQPGHGLGTTIDGIPKRIKKILKSHRKNLIPSSQHLK